MRVEIADRTVPLAENRNVLPTLLRAAQASREIGNLLAERRRAGRLSVCPREHRRACIPVSHVRQARDPRLQSLHQHRAGGPQNAGVAEIVDVLGSAAKVHQLECCGGGAGGRESVAHVVLDRLDVVIDPLLDLLDGLGGIGGWLAHQFLGTAPHCLDQGGAGKPGSGASQMQ